MRKAVVFGGSGFIGPHIVQRLARRGFTILVAARHATAARFLQPMGDVGQIVPVDLSLADDDATLAAAITGSEVVVNLIGILHERGRQRFDAVHHKGAARIARIAAASGCRRFVHLSAIGADPVSPSAYARSKAAGEAAVQAEFPAGIILRPSIVFGPGDGFFARFAAMSRRAPFLPLIGGGATKFQPVYVGDVADAVMAVLERPGCTGRTFELGGPRIYSFRELMMLVLRETGAHTPLLSLPWGLATLSAAFLQFLPDPPLTPDQIRLLRVDNVVAPGASGLESLGIAATAPELILPTYLDRFRRGGWFAMRRWPVSGIIRAMSAKPRR